MGFLREKRKSNQEDKNREQLLREIDNAKQIIENVYRNMAYIADPDMIDCCIYELNAWELRYKVLLRQMKNEESKACMVNIKK